MRRLLISLLILAGLAAGADYGARLYAQSVVAGEVRTALKLSAKPSVSFGGWPFLTHALAGNLPSATLTSHDTVADRVPIHAVQLSLRDLTFPVSRLISGGGGVIHAKRGDGFASMTGPDLTAALRDAGVQASVSIRNGRIQGAYRQFRGQIQVSLSHGSLFVSGSSGFGPPINIGQIRLPTFGHGLRYTNLKIDGSLAVLSVGIRDAAFVIPG